ncbi:MAG TPA: hypothetical protein VIT45_05145 [Allosphingosinicella sp.]
MKAYRTILAASLAATAACGGSEDPNLAADNVEFLPEEALLNDVAGRAEADNAETANAERERVMPEPAAPARPSSPPPPRPKTDPPKTVPDARPIIDPPPLERPDIRIEPERGNLFNDQ